MTDYLYHLSLWSCPTCGHGLDKRSAHCGESESHLTRRSQSSARTLLAALHHCTLDQLDGRLERPAHRPRQDPTAARIVRSYRLHPKTAAAIEAEAKRSGESQGKVIDRLAQKIHPSRHRANGSGARRCWGAVMKTILDPCCGPRSMWFDPHHPNAIFGDQRSETITVTDRSHGKQDGQRTLRIEPDEIMDFRALPFPDASFALVAFDPPHIKRSGPRSWLTARYGKLSAIWQADLAAGFRECFRVLRPDGVLIFKWNETQIKLAEILPLSPHAPLFGQVSGRRGMTHWLVFMLPNKQPVKAAKA